MFGDVVLDRRIGGDELQHVKLKFHTTSAYEAKP